MSSKQIEKPEGNGQPTRPLPRGLKIVSAITLALLGLGGILAPVVRPLSDWRWDLTQSASGDAGQINANIVARDKSGLLLSRQGRRPISIITPPLHLPNDAGPVLDVALKIPALEWREMNTHIRFLWQTENVAEFRYLDKTVALSGDLRRIRIGLPTASEIFRMGVQFPELGDLVQISSLSVPRLGIGERGKLLFEQFVEREPIAVYSLNFVRGPLILTHGLNYYLLCLLLFLAGTITTIRFMQARPLDWKVLGCCALLMWVVADAQSTWESARQTTDDTAAFRGLSQKEQIDRLDGPEIGWAYEQLLKHSPLGATFAVVSDDPFTPAHRLGYWLAPERIRVDDVGAAQFVVVIQSSSTAFDEQKARLTLANQDPLPGDLIARMSSDVYIIRLRPTP